MIKTINYVFKSCIVTICIVEIHFNTMQICSRAVLKQLFMLLISFLLLGNKSRMFSGFHVHDVSSKDLFIPFSFTHKVFKKKYAHTYNQEKKTSYISCIRSACLDLLSHNPNVCVKAMTYKNRNHGRIL